MPGVPVFEIHGNIVRIAIKTLVRNGSDTEVAGPAEDDIYIVSLGPVTHRFPPLIMQKIESCLPTIRKMKGHLDLDNF